MTFKMINYLFKYYFKLINKYYNMYKMSFKIEINKTLYLKWLKLPKTYPVANIVSLVYKISGMALTGI